MTDENAVTRLKERLTQENPYLAAEEIDKLTAALMELAAYLVKVGINHKNQEKKE